MAHYAENRGKVKRVMVMQGQCLKDLDKSKWKGMKATLYISSHQPHYYLLREVDILGPYKKLAMCEITTPVGKQIKCFDPKRIYV